MCKTKYSFFGRGLTYGNSINSKFISHLTFIDSIPIRSATGNYDKGIDFVKKLSYYYHNFTFEDKIFMFSSCKIEMGLS
ncbi:MAG: hypothetical protein P8I80_02110 [Bacteroidales bacterium]|jgi:hypothetical protein|nr:hypothetical protein [Bacteroidales bacterium]MDG2082000.1 hypothetical protein [Bacteroidales bacterium]